MFSAFNKRVITTDANEIPDEGIGHENGGYGRVEEGKTNVGELGEECRGMVKEVGLEFGEEAA